MKKLKIKVCKVRALSPQVYLEQEENFIFEKVQGNHDFQNFGYSWIVS
jgi:hypothetical protein